MPTSEQLSTWDSNHFWHSFTQMSEYQSVVIERAQGVWLYDTKGKKYLDGVSSMWCNLFGHNHPQINNAIREQLEKVAHSTSLGQGNSTAATLAKRLADLAPGDLQHVFFSSDGSSAMEVALKMAFQYWKQCEPSHPERNLFIALGEAYHGDTLGSCSVGGIERFHAMFRPLLFNVVRLPLPDARQAPEDAQRNPSAYFLNHLEEVLQEQGDQVAAVVLEPLIQAAAGMVFHPPGYLQGVRELTKKYGTLLITDEIVTGCGRTGRMFACEHEDVVPDILALGKSLTGGYLPLAATVASPEIYQAFLGTAQSGRAFYHGHTFSGNQLCTAAALATLDILATNFQPEDFLVLEKELSLVLQQLLDHPHVCEVRQKGLIAAVELTSQPGSTQAYPGELRIGSRICDAAKELGLWLRPLRDTLVIMPPLSIEVDELKFLGNALLDSIEKVTKETSLVSPAS